MGPHQMEKKVEHETAAGGAYRDCPAGRRCYVE